MLIAEPASIPRFSRRALVLNAVLIVSVAFAAALVVPNGRRTVALGALAGVAAILSGISPALAEIDLQVQRWGLIASFCCMSAVIGIFIPLLLSALMR